jgi:hypothetical protein
VNIPLIRRFSPAIALTLASLAVAVVLSGCQTTSRLPDGRRLWTAKAAPSLMGERALVIFMPDDWPARLSEVEQETYAGWADILEAFVHGSKVVRQIRRVDFRHADDYFYGHGLPVNEFTLLFIRGDGLALYAHEPIFDGAVYDYAEAFLLGREGESDWASVLHAGEAASTMPRNLKLVRLRPSPPVRAAVPVAEPEPPPASPPSPPETLIRP